MTIHKYSDYLKGTKKILDKSKKERKSYLVTVLGKEFIVLPSVFSPKYFKDTEIFAKNLSIKKGEEVLEIGSGTGIISIFFTFKGAKKVSDLERAVFDPEYKSTEKFVKEAKKYLKKNGRLLIGFSPTLGRMDLLKKFLREAGFNSKIIFQTKSREAYPVKFVIFEAKQK